MSCGEPEDRHQVWVSNPEPSSCEGPVETSTYKWDEADLSAMFKWHWSADEEHVMCAKMLCTNSANCWQQAVSKVKMKTECTLEYEPAASQCTFLFPHCTITVETVEICLYNTFTSPIQGTCICIYTHLSETLSTSHVTGQVFLFHSLWNYFFCFSKVQPSETPRVPLSQSEQLISLLLLLTFIPTSEFSRLEQF